ncbi:MAG: XRE family transcriptional regulator [Nitriliruptoraceae bacterium]
MLEQTTTEDPVVTGELRQRVATSVRDLRARSGRSLADLASAAGIGKSTLHAIEAGEANPGIETLWALARALGVPFGDLLDPPAPVVRVVRAGQAPQVASESAAMKAHLLASTGHRARVELYDLVLQPGRVHDGQAHTEGTTEHVLVTRGELRVGPAEQAVHLGVGDLAAFASDRAHTYEALVADTEAIMMIEYP